MKKHEIELIIRWAQVTMNNDCVAAAPGAERASYRPRILSAALASLFSVSAWSQTQLATVSGTITDPSGSVVPGVSVTIASQGTGLKRSALTDTAGEYRFAGLPTGTYSDADREHILETLEQANWLIGGQDGAANRLGLPRTTLIYKMRKLGIETRRSLGARTIRHFVDEQSDVAANR